MLDNIFYRFNKLVADAGPDWAVIAVFAFLILCIAVVFIGGKFPIVSNAGIRFIVVGGLLFIPTTIFDTMFEFIYLKLGLITPWYVDNTPLLLRMPTLYIFSVILYVACWTLIEVVKHFSNGIPFADSKQTDLRFKKAAEIDKARRQESIALRKDKN